MNEWYIHRNDEKMAKHQQNDENNENLAIHTVKKSHCLPTTQ